MCQPYLPYPLKMYPLEMYLGSLEPTFQELGGVRLTVRLLVKHVPPYIGTFLLHATITGVIN